MPCGTSTSDVAAGDQNTCNDFALLASKCCDLSMYFSLQLQKQASQNRFSQPSQLLIAHYSSLRSASSLIR